jgi:hypothetical protein
MNRQVPMFLLFLTPHSDKTGGDQQPIWTIDRVFSLMGL